MSAIGMAAAMLHRLVASAAVLALRGGDSQLAWKRSPTHIADLPTLDTRMSPQPIRYGRNAKSMFAAVMIALLPCSGMAQAVIKVDPSTKEDPAAQKPQPPIAVLPPAYEDSLMRLAEILGSLHYLRELCGADEGTTWREQMERIIVLEEPDEGRKARMVGRFNRGFRGFQEIYRECTPAAAEAANRYLRQGMRIAGEIPARYGQ
ncbi:MAG: TIGR02301 family protein [Rhizobiaceae bacterium]